MKIWMIWLTALLGGVGYFSYWFWNQNKDYVSETADSASSSAATAAVAETASQLKAALSKAALKKSIKGLFS
jgi:uncharacterized membrane protein YebE (DUF533 family)